MAHDLLAELAGYRNELARENQLARTDRAAAIRTEIARVRKAIASRAEVLDAEGDNYVEAGQDLKAAQAAIEARALRKAIDDGDPGQEPAAAPAEPETAADSRPRRTTTPRKKA